MDDPEELRKIWWIASFPKSGNTLVRLFLNAYVTKFPLNINAHYQYACIDQQPNLYQHVAAKPIPECDPMEILYLRPAMLMHYIQLIAPRDACFKTHNANVAVDGISIIPPRLTKQAVYLVRDPRDVAISYSKHSNISIDKTIDIMASNEHVGKRSPIDDIIMSWSANVDSWINSPKFPVELVKFEDMIADREGTFRRILPALGFREIDEEALQFALNETSFENLKKQEGDSGFRESKSGSFFRVGKAEQWRDNLTADQILRIENNHRHTMQRCGYECQFDEDQLDATPNKN